MSSMVDNTSDTFLPNGVDASETASGSGSPPSPSLHRSLSFSDRERAIAVVQQYTPSLTVIKQLRRNFSKSNLQIGAPLTWDNIKQEAIEMVALDNFLEPYYTDRIIQFDDFSSAICYSLAESFECTGMTRENWASLFKGCYNSTSNYNDGMGTCEWMGMMDLAAVRERDPSATNLVRPFLYFKGYRAIQAHRISHVLWRLGRQDAALLIQSRMCELWSVDIHPASIIDCGLMIDHGTGVVIGETAVIGSNCSFLHGVTLGSSGKSRGDRHPKLGNDILVGCGATILGNIHVGSNTKIGSGSIVVKTLPCCITAVGNPARIVGKSQCISAANEMDLALTNVKYCNDIKTIPKSIIDNNDHGSSPEEKEFLGNSDGKENNGYYSTDHGDVFRLCPRTVFSEVDVTKRQKLTLEEVGTATGLRFGITPPKDIIAAIFNDSDKDNDGFLTYREYEEFTLQIVAFTSNTPAHQPYLDRWEKYVKESPRSCMYLIARARLELDACDSFDRTQSLNNLATVLIEERGNRK